MFIYNSIPTIVAQDNVVTPDECQYIIEFAKRKGLQENRVNIDGTQKLDPMRTSTGTVAQHNEDLVIHGILERLASIARVPLSHAEPATIQRYEVGQEYKPHTDAFTDEEKVHDMYNVDHTGNRAATIILYLNDSDGGSTGFPYLGFMIQAIQGRILLFGNLDENKKAHPLSTHMGLPPDTGEKWILTLWFREKEYVSKKTIKRRAKTKRAKKGKD